MIRHTSTPIGIYKVQPGDVWESEALIAADSGTDGRSYLTVRLDHEDGLWFMSPSVYGEQAPDGWVRVSIPLIVIPPGCSTLSTFWETVDHTAGGWRLDSAVSRPVRTPVSV